METEVGILNQVDLQRRRDTDHEDNPSICCELTLVDFRCLGSMRCRDEFRKVDEGNGLRNLGVLETVSFFIAKKPWKDV